jgi:hypothetical protein
MKQRTTERASRLQSALLAGLAIVLAAATPATGADPALNVRYGYPATTLAPDIDAMAGTGVALYRGGFSNVLNPACLTDETGHRADGAIALTQMHEDRFQPLYDTFSSYVADTGIASSRSHFFGTGFAVAGRLPLGWKPVTAALSLTDRYSFDYGFSEQVLNPSLSADQRDKPVEDRSVEIGGALRALSGGAAVQLTPRVSLGLAAHYGFGTREQTTKRRIYPTPTASLFEDTTYEMAGLNFTFGARVHVGERLDLGFAYESPMAVTGDTNVKTTLGSDADSVMAVGGTAGVDYPRCFRAGLAYRPRSSPRTIFTVDAAVRKWTELTDSRLSADNPLLLQDAWDVRFGLEHSFYNGVPVRFGFRRLDSYDDREAGASFYTAGVGMAAVGGMVNLSAELSKTTSIRPHWFPYPTASNVVAGDLARVESTSFRVGVGFTREF